MATDNLFVAGLVEGYNFPKGKFGPHRWFIDLEDCRDIIIVDRSFFLKYNGLIHTWAMARENEQTQSESKAIELP